MLRTYSLFDQICLSIDQAVRTLTHHPQSSGKIYPAATLPESELTTKESKHVAGLMRVNHAGEVCAQALYHGQGIVSHTAELKAKMQQAAIEEGDHLLWCQKRLQELNSHTSYLNPFWYAGSFTIGLLAGMIGDAWSLGFVAETEQQVIKHLHKHKQALPPQDQRSLAILQQMQDDEAKHHDEAITAGAKELPSPIKITMSWIAKIMVKTAYWV